MKKYLLKIHPLEPFTFGGENGFSFEEIDYKGTYFMESKKKPEQTTVIGLVRYLMLQSEGLLKNNFSYSMEEKEKMAVVCGTETFSFQPEQEQSFGYIKELSPLFLLDEEEDIYIRNPYCNIAQNLNGEYETAFRPMKMSAHLACSHGDDFRFPIVDKEGYKGKIGYGSGYICISADKREKERLKPEDYFFRTQVITGNRKNNEAREDGLFRRETVALNQGAFGLYLTLADEAKPFPRKSIAYMGKQKAAFQIEAEKIEGCLVLKEQAEAFFASYGVKEDWYCCLSDLLPYGTIRYKNFAIVETKLIRNLRTDYSQKGMSRKDQNRYHLITAGSAFYGDVPEALSKDKNGLRKMGYNQIIKIGGKD